MRRAPGFTLLELVTATAILGMVFLAAATSLYVAVLTWERSFAHSARLQQRMLIDRFVDAHLRQLVPFEWKDEDGKGRQLFLGENGRLLFACRRRLDDGAGGLRFVRLSLEEGRLLAEFSDLPLLSWGDWDGVPVHREFIGEKLERLEFAYADYTQEDGLAWFESWDTESARVPLAVQMNLCWEDGENDSWLCRAAGAAVRETLGGTVFR